MAEITTTDLPPPLRDCARIVKRHGGQLSSGGWCRAVVPKDAAQALADELRQRCYQVRSISPLKDGAKSEVVFR